MLLKGDSDERSGSCHGDGGAVRARALLHPLLGLLALTAFAQAPAEPARRAETQAGKKPGKESMNNETQPTTNLYVATNGNDAWSGALPEPNAAGTDGPFATLRQAREAVRKLRDAEGKLPGPVTVQVRGGKYFPDETLVLGPEDSGTRECPVTWEAYPGEKPVLCGGRLLTNWEREGDRFWSAPASWNIRQLYVGGGPRSVARLPETGSWQHASVFAEPYDPCFNPPPSAERRSTLVYKAGQLPADFALKHAEFVVVHSWDDSHTRAAAHDPATRTLRFDPPCTYAPGFGSMEYYVLNLREGMTKPGQWYLDRERGRIVYWPLPGEEPERCRIEAPLLDGILRVEGGDGHPVTGIVITGLTFDLSASGDAFRPLGIWSEALAGAISLRHARDCRLADLTIRRAGGQGIKIADADHTTVEGCDIAHVGACGIAFRSGAHNAMISNRVRHVGELHHFATGIHAVNSSHGRIAHNEVSDGTYTGIASHGGAGNRVEFNHVWNVMNALSDGGCIYLAGESRGSKVRGNSLHGSRGRGGCMGFGLYLDIGCEDVTCEQNLVYDTGDYALHVHMARQNVIRDNIFVCGPGTGISFQGSTDCLFARNVVYGTDRELWFRNPAGARFTGNVHWSAAGAPRFRCRSWYGTQPFPSGYGQEASRYPLLDAVPEVARPPGPDDWDRAKVIVRLVTSHGEEAPPCHRAETRFLRQGDWLHVRTRIEQRPTDPVAARAWIGEGESVRLFLKPCSDRPEFLQLSVNAEGQAAAELPATGPARLDWTSSVQRLANAAGWQTMLSLNLADAVAVCGAGKPVASVMMGYAIGTPPLEFAAWQAMGRDGDGRAADPLFVDAVHDDYRLRPDSPALKLGFVPIPVDRIGIRKTGTMNGQGTNPPR